MWRNYRKAKVIPTTFSVLLITVHTVTNNITAIFIYQLDL